MTASSCVKSSTFVASNSFVRLKDFPVSIKWKIWFHFSNSDRFVMLAIGNAAPSQISHKRKIKKAVSITSNFFLFLLQATITFSGLYSKYQSKRIKKLPNDSYRGTFLRVGHITKYQRNQVVLLIFPTRNPVYKVINVTGQITVSLVITNIIILYTIFLELFRQMGTVFNGDGQPWQETEIRNNFVMLDCMYLVNQLLTFVSNKFLSISVP